MVDIHCHILHGIDDGAENFDTSFEMAKLPLRVVQLKFLQHLMLIYLILNA